MDRSVRSAAGDPQPFWQTKPLEAMSDSEWEALCDGCGRCCLVKYEDIDTGEIAIDSVACAFLDEATCRCMIYAKRLALNPACRRITPRNVNDLFWLPDTCAYRLLAQGRDLPHWHPLVSGDPQSVHRAGVSILNP
jgi:uncharacterized cysteine cluster protein YcgN (CxxCxxCC family)